MKCTQAQSLMQAFLDYSIKDEELGPFLDHIEECRECRDELELYSAVYDSLRDERTSDAELKDMTAVRLQEKLSDARSYLRRKRSAKIFLKVLAVLLCLTVVIVFYVGFLHERIRRLDLFGESPEIMTEAVTQENATEEIATEEMAADEIATEALTEMMTEDSSETAATESVVETGGTGN